MGLRTQRQGIDAEALKARFYPQTTIDTSEGEHRVGEGTSPARAEVVAAREALLAARGQVDEELVRLEASARAAVDIRAKVRRNPVKAAGLAAGAGFLAVGGPKRLFRRAKRAVMGPAEPLPKSMLPKEIDAALGKLGDDGDRVRGTIEREFARYLDDRAEERKSRDLTGTLSALAAVRRQAVRDAIREGPGGAAADARCQAATASSWTRSARGAPGTASRADRGATGTRDACGPRRHHGRW